MQSVLAMIQQSADNLYVFIGIIEKDITLTALCHQLKAKCSKELSLLLKKYDIDIENIERECPDDDDFFIEISMKIDNFVEVSRNLKIPERKMELIMQQKQDDSERKVAVLWAWKRKMGSDATYLVLIKAFLDVEDRLIAECIMKYAKNVFTTPQTRKTSQIAPEKSFRNWATLSESEQERIRNDLIQENSHVRETYASLIVKLNASFINRNVNPRKVQLFVESYGIPEGSKFSSSAFEFNKDDNMDDVFLILSRHSSWFNHQLFTVTVNNMGDQSEKNLLKHYQETTLIPYLKRCIFEIPSQSFSLSLPSQNTNLFLKVFDKILLTGLEVEAIQRNLAELLGLNTSILHFQCYEKGCFELVFSANTAVFNPLKCRHLEWEPSREAFRITTELVTILSYAQSPEVIILTKIIEGKQIEINQLEPNRKELQTKDEIAQLNDQLATMQIQRKKMVQEISSLRNRVTSRKADVRDVSTQHYESALIEGTYGKEMLPFQKQNSQIVNTKYDTSVVNLPQVIYTTETLEEVATLYGERPKDCITCKRVYIGILFRENIVVNQEWVFTFVVIKKLNALVKYVESYFSSAERVGKMEFTFNYTDGCLELIIDPDLSLPYDIWNINLPMKPVKIFQRDVDAFGCISTVSFPSRIFKVSAKAVSSGFISYSIPLTGISCWSESTLYMDVSFSRTPERDDIDRKEYTRPSIIFHKQCANLLILMKVNSYRLTLGSQLLANCLISFETYQSSFNDTGDRLLMELNALLVFQPFITLHKIVDVLKNVDGFQYIAKKMEHDLKEPVFSSYSHYSKDDLVLMENVRTFQEQYVTLAGFLSNTHNRIVAASHCYAAYLISREIYTDALNTTNTSYENGVILLNALHAVISTEPDAFKRLTRVLEELVKNDSIDLGSKLMINNILQKMN